MQHGYAAKVVFYCMQLSPHHSTSVNIMKEKLGALQLVEGIYLEA